MDILLCIAISGIIQLLWVCSPFCFCHWLLFLPPYWWAFCFQLICQNKTSLSPEATRRRPLKTAPASTKTERQSHGGILPDIRSPEECNTRWNQKSVSSPRCFLLYFSYCEMFATHEVLKIIPSSCINWHKERERGRGNLVQKVSTLLPVTLLLSNTFPLYSYTIACRHLVNRMVLAISSSLISLRFYYGKW